MTKMLSVARWEFLERIKSKAFLFSLILMPVIMAVFGLLPTLLVSGRDSEVVTIGIADETGSLFEELRTKLESKYKLENGSPIYRLRNLTLESSSENVKEYGAALAKSEEIEGYFLIPSGVFDSAKVEYRAKNASNLRVIERFQRTFEELISARRFRQYGLDPKLIASLNADVDVRTFRIGSEGKEEESGFLDSFLGAYFYVIMLMFLVMTSGQILVRSFVEEKSNRVIEVLLSSASSKDLMIGKIVGMTGLGLVQVSVWLAVALAIALKTGSSFINPETISIGFLYFALGYLMYVGIFVGVGSTATTEQESQQMTSYISLFLVFPIVLAPFMMQNSSSTLVQVLSFIPPLTPSMILMRLAIVPPPLWEIVATTLLLVVTNYLVMVGASRIFRLAILSYGKRPSFSELKRWLLATS